MNVLIPIHLYALNAEIHHGQVLDFEPRIPYHDCVISSLKPRLYFLHVKGGTYDAPAPIVPAGPDL